MRLSDLAPAQLRARCHGGGLRFRTGEFSICLQTRLTSVIDAVALLYAQFPLLDDDAYIDFPIVLERPRNVRRWWRPQVRFLVDGHAPFQPLPLDQAYPMFEWGLNWCVSAHAHGYLMIHAAVVEKNGRAAILPAPPGSGKSTLCAALVHNGWRLLSDELTLVRPQDGHVLPLPRPISLKNGSIALMRDFLSDPVFSPAVIDTHKGTVAHLKAPTDSVLRHAETALPAWIIFPRYEAGADAVLTAVGKASAHVRVAKNAFNYSLLGGRGFDTLADLIDRCDSHEFRYSRLDDALATFERLPPGQP